MYRPASPANVREPTPVHVLDELTGPGKICWRSASVRKIANGFGSAGLISMKPFGGCRDQRREPLMPMTRYAMSYLMPWYFHT